MAGGFLCPAPVALTRRARNRATSWPEAHRADPHANFEEHNHMLKIVSEGDGRFRLLDASDFPMGWIAGLAIGFRGFVNELHARGAAALGWRALDTTLSGQYAGWPRRNIR